MNPDDTHPMSRLRQWRRRLPPSLYFVVLGAVLLIGAIWTAALVAIAHERNTAMAEAQKETVNLATAFQEHSIRTIRAVDAEILRTKEVVERRGPEGAQREMKALHAANEEVLTVISVTDRDGNITASSLETGSVNVAHRVHFRAHAERADAGLVFGVPVQGQRTKQWTMHVARRINQPDGSFGGIVTAGVELDYLNKFYREIDLGEGGLITLLGRDGYLRARGDSRGITAGQNLRGTSQIIQRVERDEMRGSLTDVSPIDGIRRIVSFRALPGYPLIVTVGISEAQVLQHFGAVRYNYTISAAALTTLVLLLAAALGALLWQQIRANAQLRASEARFRAFTDLGADWYWESDAQHRLAFASAGVSRWIGAAWTGLAGRTLREAGFLPADTPRREPRQRIEDAGPFRDSLLRYVAPSGDVSYFSASGEPVHSVDGRFAGHRGICRDITNEMRLQQRLRLQNEAARLLTSSKPVDEVITELLREICATFGWVWGVRRVADRQAGTLACLESWCVPELEASEIVQATRATVYPFRPDGLIASAIETGEPLWRAGFSRFPDSRRADLARKAGIREVVVLPIPQGDSTRYVLQFSSRHPEYPDPISLDTLRAISTEIAQFLAGRAAQVEHERLRAQRALLASLARATNEAATPDDAMRTCLARLCAAGNWVLGRAGIYQPGGDLRFPDQSLWHGDDLSRYQEFIRVSEDSDYLTRTGPLINRVLRERAPVWLDDAWNAPSFPRGTAARRAGLRAAFAFPILVQGEVAGFLELYADAPRTRDAELMAAAETIAAQLAHVVERGRALAASAHLAAIVENSNDAMLGRTLDGVVMSWNAAAERLLGWKHDEIVGQRTSLLVPPEHERESEQAKEKLRRGEPAVNYETVRRRKDGSLVEVEVRASIVRNAAGEPAWVASILRDLTERRRSEALLRESEARFRSAFEDAAIGMALTRPDGRLLQVNAALCRMLGYSAAELLQMTFRDITAPEDLEANLIVYERALAGEIPGYQLEKRYRRKDGATIWALLASSLVRDPRGDPLYFVAQVQDVTERKTAAQALQRSQNRLQALIDSIDGIVWEGDAQTFQFNFVSTKAEQLLGYPVERWLEEPTFWRDHIHPDDRERAVNYCMESTIAQRDHEFEYRMIAADGRNVWLRDIVTVTSDGGRAVRLSGIMVDVTAHKQAEEERERLATIVQHSGDAIWSRTLDGTMLSWNPAAEHMFGWTREEIVGQDGAILIPGASRQDRQMVMDRLAQGENPVVFEGVRLRKGGALIPVEARTSAMRDTDGNIFCLSVAMHDVTERKRAEGARAQLAAIVENATVAIFSRMLDGTILTWNSGAEKMLGYTPAEAIGKPIAFTLPPGRPPNLARNNESLLRGEVAARESDRMTKDGRVIDVLTSHSPIRDGAGQIVGASVILQDITALKRAQAAVKESEERFRTIFDHAAFGITQRTPFGDRYTVVNPAFAGMLGYTPEELVSMSLQDFAHPDELAQVQENRERMLRGEIKRISGERRLIRKDGSVLWVNRTMTLVRTASGEPQHLIGVFEDISERKRVEDALRESEVRYRTLVENSPYCIHELDLQGRLTSMNRAGLKMMGVEDESGICGLNYLRIVAEEDRARIGGLIERALQGDASEFEFTAANGRSFQSSFVPILDPYGAVQRLMGLTQDITERKRVERALQESTERLQMLSRRLIDTQERERAVIARELHDQTGQVLSAAKITLQAMRRDAKARPFTPHLAEALQLLDTALQQVRTLSYGLRPPQLDDLGLVAALRNYAERIAGAAGVRLHFTTPSLPRLPGQLDIACFRVAQEAVTNVVRHAGAKNLWIKLACDGVLWLEVRDDGTGCDMAEVRRRALRGESMGVINMEERTLLGGGKIEIDSMPGNGTIVRATFPLPAGAPAAGDSVRASA